MLIKAQPTFNNKEIHDLKGRHRKWAEAVQLKMEVLRTTTALQLSYNVIQESAQHNLALENENQKFRLRLQYLDDDLNHIQQALHQKATR